MNENVPGSSSGIFFFGLGQWMLPLVLVWARVSSVAEAGRQPDFAVQSPAWPGSETLNRDAYSVQCGGATPIPMLCMGAGRLGRGGGF